jgi:hypothetical protein
VRTDPTFIEKEIIKCIVQPDKVLLPNSPHNFIFKENYYCVNEAKMNVDYQRFPNSTLKIQLNHYFCRSLAEIDLKLIRGRGDAGTPWKRRRFEDVNDGSIILDTSATNWVTRISAALQGEAAVGMEVVDPASLLKTMSLLAQAIHPAAPLTMENVVLIISAEMTEFMRISDIALAAEVRDDYAVVKKSYLELIKHYPHRVIGYTTLAIASLQLNDPSTAWDALTVAWRLAPNSFLVLQGMTNYFLRVRNFLMAEKTCALLLEISSYNLISLGYMTEALIGQERFEEAIKIGVPVVRLANMVSEMPVGMITYLVSSMAGYLEAKGDYPTLVSLWEAALKSQPDHVGNRQGLMRAKKLASRKSLR